MKRAPSITDHQPTYEATRATAGERGYDTRWRKVRRAFLRAHPICERCKIEAAQDVHHMRALRRGGSHDEANLQALCHACHSTVTNREMERGK